MKLVSGWQMPDWDTHFEEFFSKFHPAPGERTPYQEAQREYALSFVTDWRTVLDVGGNVGTWSHPLSERFDNVIAFEPHPENRACYETNMAEKTNWVLTPVALSDTEGKLPLYIHNVSCGNISLEHDGVINGPTHGKPTDADIISIEVEVKTIDSFGFHDVDFIKIDVQGHEHGVLKGATKLLTEQSPVLVLELPQRYPEEIVVRNEITEWLKQYGYILRGNKGKETVYTK